MFQLTPTEWLDNLRGAIIFLCRHGRLTPEYIMNSESEAEVEALQKKLIELIEAERRPAPAL